MKLNKNGWGTLEMFLLSGGLLIALLVAVFFISVFYNSMGARLNSKEYIDLENEIELAAQSFIENSGVIISGQYKLTLATLKKANYITNFEDNNGNPCNGYVMVKNIDNILKYDSYILCNDYQTENY